MRIKTDFVAQNDYIAQVAVIKKVYFVRTEKILYYFGKCEGQCGVDANGKIIIDDDQQDLTKVRTFILPEPDLMQLITFKDSGALVFKSENTYLFGSN